MTYSLRTRIAAIAILTCAGLPAANAQPVQDAIVAQSLLDQAYFWSLRQPDAAIGSLRHLLRIQPANPVAIALLGEVAAAQDMPEVATARLRKLQSIDPADPRIAALGLAIRVGPPDQAAIEDARARATAQDFTGAIAAYRRAFNSKDPPDIYAQEFDASLQAIDKPLPEGPCCDNQTAAWQNLTAVAARYPDIPSLALAAAIMQSYDEGARPDAVDALAKLAQDPRIAPAARKYWRQALLWQGPDLRAQDQLEDYLRLYPSDPQLDVEQEDYRRSLPSDVQRVVWQGYTDMQDNNFEDAEKQFTTALATEPHSAENLKAMAVLREHQKRIAEARKLIEQAIAIAPDQKDDLLQIINLGPSNEAALAQIRRDYAGISHLTDAGQYQQAEAALGRLKGSHRSAAYFVQLGSIQMLANENGAAADSFQRALALHPADPTAMSSLARLHSNDLRARALAEKDVARKEQRLRLAVAADPASPWPRLDLAGLLADDDRLAAADRIMAPVAAGPQPDADDIHTAMLWADRRNDLPRAARLVALLRPKDETSLSRRLAQRVTVSRAIAAAIAEPDPALRRARLLDTAAAPDSEGVRGTAVARAFIRLNDAAGARQAIALALHATPAPTAQQRLAYIGPLNDAGYPADAHRLADHIDPQTLPASLRTAYGGTVDALAINTADRLNQDAKPKQALAVLAQRLQREPESTPLNLALGRVYLASGDGITALHIGQLQMRRDPADLDAQRGTVDAAIAAGDLALAARIATQAVLAARHDPRGYLMLAEVDDARDDKASALRALRIAQSIRIQQLAEQHSGDITAGN